MYVGSLKRNGEVKEEDEVPPSFLKRVFKVFLRR